MSLMPPIVKLEIKEMKHQISHYLQSFHGQVEVEVEKQIERAIESYNFEYQVTNAVHDAIDRAIRHYFERGDGFLFVYNAVVEVMNKTFGGSDEQKI